MGGGTLQEYRQDDSIALLSGDFSVFSVLRFGECRYGLFVGRMNGYNPAVDFQCNASATQGS